MSLEQANCKIPRDWSDRIDELASAARVSRSEILKTAIARYLGIEAESNTVNPPLSEVTGRIDQIETQLTALTQSMEALQNITSTVNLAAIPPQEQVDRLAELVKDLSDRLGKSNPKPKGFG